MKKGGDIVKIIGVLVALGVLFLTTASSGVLATDVGEYYPAEATAVIMVDPFNDFIAEGGKLWERIKPVAEQVNLIENLKRLTEGARSKGVRVVYAPHRRWREGDYENWKFLHRNHIGASKFQVFANGEWGGEFHDELKPMHCDAVAKEHWLTSAFPNTDLDYILRQHGIEYVVVVGLVTNTCVESTGRYAVEMGYHTTFLTDAVAAFSLDEHEAAIKFDYPRIAHAVRTVDEFLSMVK